MDSSAVGERKGGRRRGRDVRYLLSKSLVRRMMNLLTLVRSSFIAASPFSFSLSLARPSRPLMIGSSYALWNSTLVPR